MISNLCKEYKLQENNLHLLQKISTCDKICQWRQPSRRRQHQLKSNDRNKISMFHHRCRSLFALKLLSKINQFARTRTHVEEMDRIQIRNRTYTDKNNDNVNDDDNNSNNNNNNERKTLKVIKVVITKMMIINNKI